VIVLRTFVFLLALAISFSSLPGCKVYSFTGANIKPEIQTVSIGFFDNKANNGPANLSQAFTDRLKLKMLSEANLKQTAQNGDLDFSGYISGYQFSSQAPTSAATGALNRLTISVKVEFVNSKDEKDNFSQEFRRFAEFPATENLQDIEQQLITEINQQLVDDVFNRALVKW
jgi:hypothetical protein